MSDFSSELVKEIRRSNVPVLPAGIWSSIGEAAAPADVTGAAVVLRPGKRKRVVTGLEESSPHPESHPASFPDSSHNEPQLLQIICHMTPQTVRKLHAEMAKQINREHKVEIPVWDELF